MRFPCTSGGIEGGNQPGNFLDSEVLSATSLDECAANCKAKEKPLIGITDIDCPEKPGTFDCHCGATKPVKKFDEAQCRENILSVNPDAQILAVSSKTGQGMDAWFDFLNRQVEGLMG